jgi:hypothetical protein
MLAIPDGIKCFAWFTTHKEQNVCFVIELNKNKQIQNTRIIKSCFNPDLVKGCGTVFYGTKIYYSKNHFFIIEDISYNKGINVSNKNWFDKFILFKDILDNYISQACYNTYFALPVMSNNYNDLINKIKMVKYKIHTIQFKYFNKSNVFLYAFYIPNNICNKQFGINNKQNSINNNNNCKKIKNINNKERKEIIFCVKPDIQNDIYSLYCCCDDKLILYDFANIPDYKTSVMMNKLFRTIKENDNLDYLEESDDEEEFENEDNCRFVKLDISYNMVCSYNYKFKKWTPIKLTENNTIVTTKELKLFLYNN